MVASNRTHVSTFNNAMAGASLSINWQNAVLFVHQQLKLAGFTVDFSSNGVTADATDNISTVADIVSAAATNPHTWVQYDPPAIMGDWKLILDCNDPDATPREVDWFATSSSGYNADGDINDRPTPVTSTHEWNRINVDLVPSAIFQPMSMHATRASDGEILIGLSVDGSLAVGTAIWIVAPKNGDDPTNAYDYGFYFSFFATGALQITQLQSNLNWRGHAPDNNDRNTLDLETPAIAMGTFTLGVSNASGDIPVCPIDWIHSSGTISGISGRSEDHRMAPATVPQSIVEDGDTDAQRRLMWDNLWVVVQSSALPMTL